jgi:hypothetical protein
MYDRSDADRLTRAREISDHYLVTPRRRGILQRWRGRDVACEEVDDLGDTHAFWSIISPLEETRYVDQFRAAVFPGASTVYSSAISGAIVARRALAIVGNITLLGSGERCATTAQLIGLRNAINVTCTDPRLLHAYDALALTDGTTSLSVPVTYYWPTDGETLESTVEGLVALGDVVTACGGDPTRLREAEILAVTGCGDGTVAERYRSLARVLRLLHADDPVVTVRTSGGSAS